MKMVNFIDRYILSEGTDVDETQDNFNLYNICRRKLWKLWNGWQESHGDYVVSWIERYITKIVKGYEKYYKNKEKIIVLDIGCSAGLYHNKLKDVIEKASGKECYIIGLDARYEDLKGIKRKGINNIAKFISGDAYKLPFKGSSIDFIFSSFCIEIHIPFKHLYSEIKRIIGREPELPMDENVYFT